MNVLRGILLAAALTVIQPSLAHHSPAAFDGDDYGEDKANTPWGYDQASGEELRRGDWLLDPARALAYHANFEGEYSLGYLLNRYFVDLGLLGDGG